MVNFSAPPKSGRVSFLFRIISILILPFIILMNFQTRALAQGATPSASTAVWEINHEVTEVGRNADRARQLLWWVWSHPGIFTAPVLAEMWGDSRNIVYVFIVLVIIAFGIAIMIGRRQGNVGPIFSGIASPVFGLQIPSIFMKLGMVLLYVTFSYVLVLALIQFSEITMAFIKSIIGKDLFNIFFAGAGNIEDNYRTFIGYYNTDPTQREMVNTSLFLVRLTSFTYNVMSVILILRTVILWYLLILSPFLAILMPFVFIRNTGWIWIGVFFQWLFYGPLMVLFIVAMVKIWIAGIPLPFNFTRVNTLDGQVYSTSINILYGGPAQTLSTGNSANYVDTYAEYVIALIMIWAAMLLPWLLLRIFRDYCCNLFAAGNATLTAIFDRMRQYPPPPPPTPTLPPSSSGIGQELPFRQRIDEKLREYKQTTLGSVRELSRATTSEIARAMEISVSSLRDISRLETNNTMRSEVMSRLERLAAPERVTTTTERERYETIKKELETRAASGDKIAQSIIIASQRNSQVLAHQIASVQTQRTFAPSVSYSMPSTSAISSALSQSSVVSNIAQQVGESSEKVKQVLSNFNTMGNVTPTTVKVTAEKVNVPEAKVQEILRSVQKTEVLSSVLSQQAKISDVARETNITSEKVKEVLTHVSSMGGPTEVNLKETAQKSGVTEIKVKEIVEMAARTAAPVTVTAAMTAAIPQVSNTVNLPEAKVSEVLRMIPMAGVPTVSEIKSTAEKVGISETKVEEILKTTESVSSMVTMAPQVAKQVGLAEEKVKEVLKVVPLSVNTTIDTIKSTAEKVGISETKVEEILKTSQSVSTTAMMTFVSQIAERSGVTKEKVQDLLKIIPVGSTPTVDTIKSTAEKVGISETNVKDILNTIEKTIPVVSIVTQVAQKIGVPQDKISEVLKVIPLGATSSIEIIKSTAERVGISESKVKEILKISESAPIITTISTAMIPQIAKQTDITNAKVEQILSSIPAAGLPTPSAIKDAAQKAGVTEKKVQSVLAAAKTPVEEAAGIAPTISFEDYEEVKRMWLAHYREAPVPVSDTVKTRKEWLVEEQRKLTNIHNLLSSSDPKLKQEGLSQVAEILPFMLLGGFSDQETLTYIQAKLEAAKQIQTEIEMEERIKSEVEKRVKEEIETEKVPVAAKKPEAEEAAMEQEQVMELSPETPETEKAKPQEMPVKEAGEKGAV